MTHSVLIPLILIPLLMLALGVLLLLNPPKTINNFIGYRTKRSKESQKSWDYAQRKLGEGWIILSIVNFIIPLTFYLLNIKTEYTFIAFFIVQIFILISPIFFIEKHLKENRY
ncbi:MAG: SdpI family protein [Clostridium chrysemydis]|uniref:SdpI family protein n=1 Tax=Clostridium chrysemydis TaxID=2665504 RepID=UPI003F326796